MPHILILEGYRPTGQACEVILKREGWDVTLRQTDQTALETLQLYDVDVLLVDLEIPTGDGLRLLNAAEEQQFETPMVIMLDLESASQRRALSLNSVIVLPKPIRKTALLTSVETALRPHPHQNQLLV